MVNLESVNKIIAQYDVDTKLVECESDRRSLVDIISHRDDRLVIGLAFTDGCLSEVYFINNQFYELYDDEFEQLLIDLLDGAYEVRGAGDKRHIVSDHGIGPERTMKMGELERSLYEILPVQLGRVSNKTSTS